MDEAPVIFIVGIGLVWLSVLLFFLFKTKDVGFSELMQRRAGYWHSHLDELMSPSKARVVYWLGIVGMTLVMIAIVRLLWS